MSDEKYGAGGWIGASTRCGFDQTLNGRRCERAGLVWLTGLRLCEKHARRVEIEDQISLLRGIVSSLELCMRNVSIRRDHGFAKSLKLRRTEAATKLEAARKELRRNDYE